VELAAVIPLLLILAMGAGDFGNVAFRGITVANAARAAAQYGVQSTATSADTATINQAGRNDASDVTSLKVTSRSFCRCGDGSTPASCSTSCTGYGMPKLYVEVTVRDTVDLILHYPGLAPRIPLSTTALLRVN
jgi:hypothetical protein